MVAKPPALRLPHNVGDRVAIKRHHHGWLDGAVAGQVTEAVQRPTGSWRYTVVGDDGYQYEIDHTRDLRKEA